MWGNGRIFRRPTSKYWWVEYYAGGVRHQESSGCVSKRDAGLFLRKQVQLASEGKKPWAKLKVEDLLEMVKADYAVNSRKTDLRGPFKHLTNIFAQYPVSRIDTNQITEYASLRLAEGAAPATINIELAVLRRGLNLALEAGKISVAPKVKSLELRNTRKGFFEHSEFVAVLAHLPLELMPVMRTAYITGWRISELLSRRKSHVDLEAGFLRLDPGETKNGDGRMFPLTPELHAVLARQLERNRTFEVEEKRVVPWLFHRNGRRILSYRKAWATACRLAGFPGRLVHDFRRTAVRNLERAGVPRSTAMAMTGHRTESVYRRYAIVDEVMLHEAADKLSKVKQ